MQEGRSKTVLSKQSAKSKDALSYYNGGMWKHISKIVKKCERAHESSNRFMNDFKHIELVDNLKQGEEVRLRKQLEYYDETIPAFLKEILHEKHMERVTKNMIKREVREDHRIGIGDPGRLAAKSEKRMFFNQQIKVDSTGHKKHLVNL